MRTLFSAIAALLALAAHADERMLRKEALVEAPVESVHAAWTTSEGIQSFFAPEAIVEAKPGGAFFIHFNPYAAGGSRGADGMRVLAVQPGRMISFTWNAPPYIPDVRAQRTVVIVRTEAAGEGRTRVTLTHAGWGDGGGWDEAYKYFDKAWDRVLGSLRERFAKGPTDWREWLGKMRQATPEAPRVPERILRHQAVVSATPETIWKALSTPEGAARWAAPVVALDFRTGGYMRTHDDASKAIGAPGTRHLDIVNVIENELVTYQVGLAERDPAAARLEDQRLQRIVQLAPAGAGRTRIVATMVGFGSGPRWDEAYAALAKENEAAVRKLAALFPAR
ncbi:MAG TPA: SRPBCC domain-containing protein [Usitatibacter sp.]|nr:SRPBCC domain-containing protein [Usitatibacter sp.]